MTPERTSAPVSQDLPVLRVSEVTKGFRHGVLRRRRVDVLRGASLEVGRGNSSGPSGRALGRLGGTYFMLFLPMIDHGIAQTPMFGGVEPGGWAQFLPGYGAGRVLVDASFAPTYDAWPELLLALIWAMVAVAAVTVALGR